MKTPLKSLLIILDLQNKEKSYEKLYEYLQGFASWARPLNTAWLVQSEKDSPQVIGELKTLVGPADAVLVTEVDNTDWSALNIASDVTDWMKVSLSDS